MPRKNTCYDCHEKTGCKTQPDNHVGLMSFKKCSHCGQVKKVFKCPLEPKESK